MYSPNSVDAGIKQDTILLQLIIFFKIVIFLKYRTLKITNLLRLTTLYFFDR